MAWLRVFTLAVQVYLITCKGIDIRGDAGCNHGNKQKSTYGRPDYRPSLKSNPATGAYSTYKGVKITDLRENSKRGFFASTSMRTQQDNGKSGPHGYFGVQWQGQAKKNDQLLFSIWNKENMGTLPMHENCKINCNDCSSANHAGMGTQCKVKLDEKLQEGEELTLRIQREPVESETYNGVTYTGHVWKVTYESDMKGEVITLGRILFHDDDLEIGKESSGGIKYLSMFLEAIGCMKCGSVTFEAQRKGPFVTATAGNKPLPEIQGLNAALNPGSTCRAFDMVSEEFGSINMKVGINSSPPNWDEASGNNKMY